MGIIITSSAFGLQFKFMSYNALNFDGLSRTEYFETVFADAAPDIIVMQEIATEAGADALLGALNSAIGEFNRSEFIFDTDLNSVLFYNSSMFNLIAQAEIETSPRNILEYVVSINGNQFNIYSCHLKASDGTQNEQERYQAVSTLRNYLNQLPTGTEFIVAGDMNFYGSDEPGYQKFIQNETDNSGRSRDLCEAVGNWHDNSYYAEFHTQCPRLVQFGGGASGGMDDKFDFIFSSFNINNNAGIEYINDSFLSFGNDGNHFNQSINYGTNTVVSAETADALYYASDHIPVIAQFHVGDLGEQNLIISEYIEGSSNNKAIEICNVSNEIINLANYTLEKDVNGDEEWSSSFSLSGNLNPNEVFVIANPSANQTILTLANATSGSVINFNGDDQVRLVKNGLETDRIGIPGDISFGQDVTFVRDSAVTSPQNGPQDPRNNGEWIAYETDDFTHLGSHEAMVASLTVITPNGQEDWEIGNSYDILWNSENFINNIKIELFDENQNLLLTLIESTENNGSWNWTIPNDLEITNGYKIKISDSVTGNPFDFSDDFFFITGEYLADDLFISEYIEGSGNNKALEIFNGTETAIDLADYQIEIYYNGSNSVGQTISLSGMLNSSNTYVISHASASQSVLSVADLITSSLSFNGDDAVVLSHNQTPIDIIGEIGFDPGSAWSVAGETGTANKTILRKQSILSGNTDWVISAGTNADDSEWIVMPTDYFSDLGEHSFGSSENNPIISNIIITPENPLPNQDVTISADITDLDGEIISAFLFWSLNQSDISNQIEMFVARDTDSFTATIPGQAQAEEVYFYIEATDNDEQSTSSTIGNYTVQNIPDEHSIYDLQGQTEISPFDEQIVSTRGIVTATDNTGYFLQNGDSLWSGIFVSDEYNSPSIGDSIFLSGEVNEFYDFTRIESITNYLLLSENNTLPSPLEVAVDQLNNEGYEGVLIATEGYCNSTNPDYPSHFGEWTITNDLGSIRIDDLMYNSDPVLNENYRVIGPIYYSYSNFKIVPRDENDVQILEDLSTPQNIEIHIENSQVNISWQAVQNATSYKVIKMSYPEQAIEDAEIFITNDTFWIGEISDDQRAFFRVIAIN